MVDIKKMRGEHLRHPEEGPESTGDIGKQELDTTHDQNADWVCKGCGKGYSNIQSMCHACTLGRGVEPHQNKYEADGVDKNE